MTYGTTFVSFHGTVLNVPEKDQVDRILLNQDCEATKAAYPGDAGERLLTLQAEAGPVRKMERLKELVPVLRDLGAVVRSKLSESYAAVLSSI